jgi:hypothetical protein
MVSSNSSKVKRTRHQVKDLHSKRTLDGVHHPIDSKKTRLGTEIMHITRYIIYLSFYLILFIYLILFNVIFLILYIYLSIYYQSNIIYLIYLCM